MKSQYDYSKRTNQELVAILKTQVSNERKAQTIYLACLAEMEGRMLYAELGYSSMFNYCVRELGFAEGSAGRRIRTARMARQFPVIYSLIEEGKIHMTAIAMLGSLLTEANHREVLEKACGKTKEEIELLVVRLNPQPETRDLIRTLPQPKLEVTISGDREPEVEAPKPLPQHKKEEIKPITEERVVFKFTGSAELRKKLERAKQILRHKYPHGRLEDIIDEALEALLEKKDPERRIARKKKHEPFEGARAFSSSRRIPQPVKDLVLRRDGGRCQYVSPDGKPCGEKTWLEFDHIQPWALGGSSGDPDNIRLLCRQHNQFAARKAFGERHYENLKTAMAKNQAGI